MNAAVRRFGMVFMHMGYTICMQAPRDRPPSLRIREKWSTITGTMTNGGRGTRGGKHTWPFTPNQGSGGEAKDKYLPKAQMASGPVSESRRHYSIPPLNYNSR